MTTTPTTTTTTTTTATPTITMKMRRTTTTVLLLLILWYYYSPTIPLRSNRSPTATPPPLPLARAESGRSRAAPEACVRRLCMGRRDSSCRFSADRDAGRTKHAPTPHGGGGGGYGGIRSGEKAPSVAGCTLYYPRYSTRDVTGRNSITRVGSRAHTPRRSCYSCAVCRPPVSPPPCTLSAPYTVACAACSLLPLACACFSSNLS